MEVLSTYYVTYIFFAYSFVSFINENVVVRKLFINSHQHGYGYSCANHTQT